MTAGMTAKDKEAIEEIVMSLTRYVRDIAVTMVPEKRQAIDLIWTERVRRFGTAFADWSGVSGDQGARIGKREG